MRKSWRKGRGGAKKPAGITLEFPYFIHLSLLITVLQ